MAHVLLDVLCIEGCFLILDKVDSFPLELCWRLHSLYSQEEVKASADCI